MFIALSFVFGLWFALSVIRQFRLPIMDWITRYDILGLVPSWRLFAPRPMRVDYKVMRRFSTDAGPRTKWHDPVIDPHTNRWRIIWNPHRRGRKITGELGKLMGTAAFADWPVSMRLQHGLYVALLSRVSADAPREANAVQFGIIVHRKFDPEYPSYPLFVSPFHDLA
jgi:hypothetical protein